MALPQAAAPQECPLHRGTALGSGAVLLLLVFPRGPDCKQQWRTAAFLPVAKLIPEPGRRSRRAALPPQAPGAGSDYTHLV